MKTTPFSTQPPDLETWRNVARSFLDRLNCKQQIDLLRSDLDRKFMAVQAICCGVKRPTYQWRSVESLLTNLKQELSGLFQAMDLRFRHSSFGQTAVTPFTERDYIGWWCLVMEFATRATSGSAVEFSIGSLSQGIELEVGSDCPVLENADVLESVAFTFVNQLMPITRAQDLRCPLGGSAIQLDISSGNLRQHRIA